MADNNNNQNQQPNPNDALTFVADTIKELDDTLKGLEIRINNLDLTNLIDEKILKNWKPSNMEKVSSEDIEKLAKIFVEALKKIGLLGKDTQGKATLEEYFSKLEGNKYHAEAIKINLSNMFAQMMLETNTSYATNKKFGKRFFSKSEDTTVKEIDQILARGIGTKLDDLSYNINYLFNQFEQNEKKNRRVFADYLIEGLAGNKFIGGAMNDTFRLIGLYGANILRQIPLIGKFLAPVFYGVMQALGPLLTQAVVTGIVQGMAAQASGKIFDFLAGALLLGGGGRIGKVFKAKGLVGGAKTIGRFGRMKAFKAASAIKSGGALKALGLGTAAGLSLGVGALGMGAKTAVGKAGIIGGGKLIGKALGKSAAKKIPGLGLAAGIGFGAARAGAGDWVGAGLEVASGAASMLPGIGTAVSAVLDVVLLLKDLFGNKILKYFMPVIGIPLLIKDMFDFFRKKAQKTESYQEASLRNQNETKEYTKKSWWENVKDWFTGLFTGGGSSGGYSGGSSGGGGSPTNANLYSGKTDSSGHLNISSMSKADWNKANSVDPIFGKDGRILNLGQMSKARADAVIAKDIRDKGNKSYYEALKGKRFASGSFVTDSPYIKRGTQDWLEKNFFEKLAKAGFDTSDTKITSAIGTLGSEKKMGVHKYDKGSWSHYSSNATTLDVTSIKNKKNGKPLTYQDCVRLGIPVTYFVDENDHMHFAIDPNAIGAPNQSATTKGQQIAPKKSGEQSVTAVAPNPNYKGWKSNSANVMAPKEPSTIQAAPPKQVSKDTATANNYYRCTALETVQSCSSRGADLNGR